MYNRYLENNHSSCRQPPEPCHRPQQPEPCECERKEREREHSDGGLFSSLGGLLGGKEGGLSKLLDDNTLLVLLILFFLLKDDDGFDRDLLILAGVFLLLGL